MYLRARGRNKSLVCAWALALWLVSCSSGVFGQQVPTVKIGEETARHLAFNAPSPVYPSKSTSVGVAVVTVFVRADGTVASADVLQSPDELIAAEVRRAVLQWRFKPLMTGDPIRQAAQIRTKLTFYFRSSDGKQQVASPVFADTAPAAATGLPAVGPVDLASIMKQPGSKLIDVRDRTKFAADHSAGAMNIPYDELSARATSELSKLVPIVLDCSLADRWFCETAGSTLVGLGFRKVYILQR